MSGYRMFAGIIVFLIVVMGTLIAASADYPELAPRGPSWEWSVPDLGVPDIPNFGQANRCKIGIPGLDAIAEATCFIGDVIYWFLNIIWIALKSIGSGILAVLILLISFFTFDIPALENLGEIGAMIRTAFFAVFGFVVVLFLVRLIRSMMPYGSEAS